MRQPYLPLIAPRWANALMLLTVLLGAAAGLSGLRFARDAWIAIRQAATGPGSVGPVRLRLAGEVFDVPADLLRFPPASAAGTSGGVQTTRIELAVGWRRLRGFEGATGDMGLHLALIAGDDPASPRTRLERIYRPSFEGAEIAGPGGLVGRRLAASSGYGAETLFYAPAPQEAQKTDTRVFMIRCGPETSRFAPANCLRRLSLSSNLHIEYRYRKDRLARWREIEAAVKALVGQFRRSGAR